MNIFSVLDTSDNEEEVKKPSQVKKTKDAPKTDVKDTKAPAKPSEAKAKGYFSSSLVFLFFLTKFLQL